METDYPKQQAGSKGRRDGRRDGRMGGGMEGTRRTTEIQSDSFFVF